MILHRLEQYYDIKKVSSRHIGSRTASVPVLPVTHKQVDAGPLNSDRYIIRIKRKINQKKSIANGVKLRIYYS